jgi:hypothetical protein
MSRIPADSNPGGDPELRDILVRHGIRVAAAFALLFGFVFAAFWWSGAAVRFGADRAADRAVPTWLVTGTVRSAATREPIPWAVVEDDPVGKPPSYHTDANYSGAYELLTLAEPHRIRASAPGFRSATVSIGRQWFLWLPKGNEKRDIQLQPE